MRYALLVLSAVFLIACNPSPQNTQNAVGGATVISFVQTPLTKRAKSLALGWGSKGQPNQLAIADVVSYGGEKLTITAPAGWQLIRDDHTPTTRQSLYWHVIQANDTGQATWSFNQPTDAQGAMVLLDNAELTSPVDMSTGNTGSGGTLKAKSVATTSEGDLILAFFATDFTNGDLRPQMPIYMSPVVSQPAGGHEYWILSSYQNSSGSTEDAGFSFPQIVNWTAAQVAIRHGTATASTPGTP